MRAGLTVPFVCSTNTHRLPCQRQPGLLDWCAGRCPDGVQAMWLRGKYSPFERSLNPLLSGRPRQRPKLYWLHFGCHQPVYHDDRRGVSTFCASSSLRRKKSSKHLAPRKYHFLRKGLFARSPPDRQTFSVATPKTRCANSAIRRNSIIATR